MLTGIINAKQLKNMKMHCTPKDEWCKLWVVCNANLDT